MDFPFPSEKADEKIRSFIFSLLVPRHPESHKGHYGTLTAVCGSVFYRGAASLSTAAALRCGAGIVRLASLPAVIDACAAVNPECIFLPLPEAEAGSISSKAADDILSLLTHAKGRQTCLIGCGLSLCPDTEELTFRLIRSLSCPLVLDADALNALSKHPDLLAQASQTPVITPHIGEMARLTGLSVNAITSDLDGTARSFSARYGCVTVLKGHATRVASPDGKLYINTTGNPGLARGGSGDVLAGMIAAFLAQGLAPWEAAVCGVYLHGLAADRCAARLSQYGMLPHDILIDLCEIFRENGR